MRKLFLLIPALVLSLLANAAVININTGTADALRKALNSANDGDIIEMAAGTYEESNSNYIAFNAKNVIVKAADDANVIIKPHVPFTVSGGARAEIQGVKIDASELCSLGSYSHLMYASDNSDNNRLILDGCEVYGYTVGKAVIACRSSYKLDSLIINNCKFYNHTTRSCVFLENTENKGLIVTNSTFYNIATGTESFGAGIIDDRNSAAKVRVDHCTFYNVVAQTTDYAAVGKIAISDGIVSNCIFAMPTSTDGLRAIRGVAQANNCLTYNYTYDSNWGIHSSVTKNNCIQLQDPLFVDAANGDFHITDASPAYLAGSDNKSLGDKRWWPAAPEIDFATAYNLIGSKAGLVGNIRLNANNNIEYYDNSVAGTAVWEVKATRACAIEAVIDMETGSASGCIFQIKVYNENGDEVGTLNASYKETDADIEMSGAVYLPEAGVYTIKLFNSQSWSSAKVEKIILSYAGGDVQNISTSTNTTLPIADAWTNTCTRGDGYLQYPSSDTDAAWIKWNIATSATKMYDITLNIDAPNAHGLTVAIYEDEEADPVASVSEGSYVSTEGTLALELGRLNLPGDKNYVVKVTNAPSGSKAKVISVVFAPVASTSTALPNTLALTDATLSPLAHITDEMLWFNEIGDSNPVGQWAQWEVSVASTGLYLFTMNVNSSNSQTYKITILDSGSDEIDSYEKDPGGSGDKTIKHYFNLPAGNYFVKVENTRAWSQGHIVSLVVTQPSLLTIDEAATSNSVIHDNYRNGNHDIQIIRTITPGMYNTICLPFDVSSSALSEMFGNNVELLEMESATIDGTVLDLNFANATSIYRGTPYLIKTTKTVTNPVFTDVEIKAEEGDATDGDAANFIGTFIKTTIPEDPNNLFLGANNNLYFPEGGDMPIKGMRAYFAVTGSSGAPVRQARIIAQGNVATEVELINGQLPSEFGGNDLRKSIENGQLIIIRDGVQYNALGVRVK